MAEGDFEMADFDAAPEEWQKNEEDETSFILPDPPTLEPLDGKTLEEYGNCISKLTGDLRTEELQHQRDHFLRFFLRYDRIRP